MVQAHGSTAVVDKCQPRSHALHPQLLQRYRLSWAVERARVSAIHKGSRSQGRTVLDRVAAASAAAVCIKEVAVDRDRGDTHCTSCSRHVTRLLGPGLLAPPLPRHCRSSCRRTTRARQRPGTAAAAVRPPGAVAAATARRLSPTFSFAAFSGFAHVAGGRGAPAAGGGRKGLA